MDKFNIFDTTADYTTFIGGADEGCYVSKVLNDDPTIIFKRKKPLKPYFCVENTGKTYKAWVGFEKDNNLEYSIDGQETWNNVTSSGIYLDPETRVYFRRTVSTPISGGFGKLDSNGSGIKLGGNIHSLLVEDFENFYDLTGWGAIFSNFTYGCTNLKYISDLVLPATTITSNCYTRMFYGNVQITGAAPVLPATTLKGECYFQMFRGTKINKITTYAENISATDCLSGWLFNVPETGDFYNLGGATYPTGDSGIPSGWTIHTSL